ncbi:hypothetical protein C5167_044221 [Papaver somniferum]|uniref:Uncharacterized protein n=1 Tax=Papaver somniferum TaxID=3469 RepID=A0A4Y7LAH2_PAPSO|nr:hypothetical protein C5167_044221 [Papaver somniferum]
MSCVLLSLNFSHAPSSTETVQVIEMNKWVSIGLEIGSQRSKMVGFIEILGLEMDLSEYVKLLLLMTVKSWEEKMNLVVALIKSNDTIKLDL